MSTNNTIIRTYACTQILKWLYKMNIQMYLVARLHVVRTRHQNLLVAYWRKACPSVVTYD